MQTISRLPTTSDLDIIAQQQPFLFDAFLDFLDDFFFAGTTAALVLAGASSALSDALAGTAVSTSLASGSPSADTP